MLSFTVISHHQAKKTGTPILPNSTRLAPISQKERTMLIGFNGFNL